MSSNDEIESALQSGGRHAVRFGVLAALLLFHGFLIGVNVMRASYVVAVIVTIVSTFLIASIVRLYQADVRLVRVQERLRRSRAEDDIEMDATGPAGPHGYWAGQGWGKRIASPATPPKKP